MTEFEPIFNPVGIPTGEPQPDKDRVDASKVWVTNPRQPEFRIEYLRSRAESPTRAVSKTFPHAAYQAEHFDALIRVGEVLAEPFAAKDNLTVGLILKNGLPAECMVSREHRL